MGVAWLLKRFAAPRYDPRRKTQHTGSKWCQLTPAPDKGAQGDESSKTEPSTAL